MKNHLSRNEALALTGLLALSLYILACTSFSPDDTKVLYPAFSGTNGSLGIASYDRVTRRSEMLFLPSTLSDEDTSGPSPQYVRGQWLANGHRVVAGWMGNESDDVLHLASLPFQTAGPVRWFVISGKDLSKSMVLPLPIVGDRAFLVDFTNRIVRLDLQTGAVTRHLIGKEDSEWTLYAAPDGRGIFYLEGRKAPEGRVFGRLDPETFAVAPLITITNVIDNGVSFTYSLDGTKLAFVDKSGDAERLVVLERGKLEVILPLPAGGKKFCLGMGIFSRTANNLIFAFRRQKEDGSSHEFGLIEIPLNGGPRRETVILPAVSLGAGDVQSSEFYFQIGFSHDGKTAAVASTYLASMDEEFKAEDCALFFVDLSDPNRRVTKVPIPLPAHRGGAVK